MNCTCASTSEANCKIANQVAEACQIWVPEDDWLNSYQESEPGTRGIKLTQHGCVAEKSYLSSSEAANILEF